MSSKKKESSTSEQNIKILSDTCQVNNALQLISPKWKMTILFDISNAEGQFSKLQAKYPTLSDQVLSTRLRELEMEGLVTKIILKLNSPQQIVYKITPKGNSLLEVIANLQQWTQCWDNPNL